MSETAKKNTSAKRYLLGELSDDEKTRMEKAYFSDDSEFEAIELAEDELVDAYVRDQLAPDDNLRFKTKLLNSTRIKERVHFAEALAEKADSLIPAPSIEPAVLFQSPSTELKVRWWQQFFGARPAFGIAMAALILVASVVLVSGWLRLRNESQRLAADRAELQRQREGLNKFSAEQKISNEETQAKLQRDKEQLAEDRKHFEESARAQRRELETRSILGTVASILLRAGSSRSPQDPQELTLRPETSTAELKLELLNSDYRSYAVTVKSTDKVIYSKGALHPRKGKQGLSLIVLIPRSHLPPDDYVVELSGRTVFGQIDKMEGYQFRVVTAK